MATQNGLLTLKQARELRGWSQAELAKYAGVTQPAVSHIETGYRNSAVSYDVANALSGTLGVQITDIFWPFGLTGLGGPMGAKNVDCVEVEKLMDSPQCLSCYTSLPRSGQCDYCN